MQLKKLDDFNDLDLQMYRSLRAVICSKNISFDVGGDALIKVAQVQKWFLTELEPKIKKSITLSNSKSLDNSKPKRIKKIK